MWLTGTACVCNFRAAVSREYRKTAARTQKSRHTTGDGFSSGRAAGADFGTPGPFFALSGFGFSSPGPFAGAGFSFSPAGPGFSAFAGAGFASFAGIGFSSFAGTGFSADAGAGFASLAGSGFSFFPETGFASFAGAGFTVFAGPGFSAGAGAGAALAGSFVIAGSAPSDVGAAAFGPLSGPGFSAGSAFPLSLGPAAAGPTAAVFAFPRPVSQIPSTITAASTIPRIPFYKQASYFSSDLPLSSIYENQAAASSCAASAPNGISHAVRSRWGL